MKHVDPAEERILFQLLMEHLDEDETNLLNSLKKGLEQRDYLIHVGKLQMIERLRPALALMVKRLADHDDDDDDDEPGIKP